MVKLLASNSTMRLLANNICICVVHEPVSSRGAFYGIDLAHHAVSVACRWDEEESQEYVKYVSQQGRKRAQEVWQMDLSWLPENGYAIPHQLQHLCCVDKAESILEKRSEIPISKTKNYIKSKYSTNRCTIQ